MEESFSSDIVLLPHNAKLLREFFGFSPGAYVAESTINVGILLLEPDKRVVVWPGKDHAWLSVEQASLLLDGTPASFYSLALGSNGRTLEKLRGVRVSLDYFMKAERVLVKNRSTFYKVADDTASWRYLTPRDVARDWVKKTSGKLSLSAPQKNGFVKAEAWNSHIDPKGEKSLCYLRFKPELLDAAEEFVENIEPIPTAAPEADVVEPEAKVAKVETTLTSIDCLRASVKNFVGPRLLGAICSMTSEMPRPLYERDVFGELVLDARGRRRVNESAYMRARALADKTLCAIVAFDAGGEGAASFSKKYLVCDWEEMARVAEFGDRRLFVFEETSKKYVDRSLHRSAYEAVQYYYATRMFLDLEFHREKNPDKNGQEDEMTHSAIAFVCEMAQKHFDLDVTPEDFIILCADGESKASRHAICLDPRFTFATLLAMSWFYCICEDHLLDLLDAEAPLARLLRVKNRSGADDWFWDFGTTSHFQLLRTAFSTKFGQQRYLLPKKECNPLAGGETRRAIYLSKAPKQQFLDALVQRPVGGIYDEQYRFLDFSIFPGARIGRFLCRFNDFGAFVGFERQGGRRRAGAAGVVARAPRALSLMSNAGMDDEMQTLLTKWLRSESWAACWPASALDVGKFRYRRNPEGKCVSAFIRMEGGNLYCPRRAMLSPLNPYHEKTPVVLHFVPVGEATGVVVVKVTCFHSACRNTEVAMLAIVPEPIASQFQFGK